MLKLRKSWVFREKSEDHVSCWFCILVCTCIVTIALPAWCCYLIPDAMHATCGLHGKALRLRHHKRSEVARQGSLPLPFGPILCACAWRQALRCERAFLCLLRSPLLRLGRRHRLCARAAASSLQHASSNNSLRTCMHACWLACWLALMHVCKADRHEGVHVSSARAQLGK